MMVSTDRMRLGALALTFALVSACSPDAGPDFSGTRSYVSTMGMDTFTVETLTRTADRIEGTLVERNPYTHVIGYSADLDANGNIRRLEATRSVPSENPDGPGPQSWVIEVADQGATITREGGDNAGTTEVADAEPGAIPTLGRVVTSMLVWDVALHQVRSMEHQAVDQHPLELLMPANPEPTENAVTIVSEDTVSMSFFGNPMKAWTEGGPLAGISGAETTMKQEVRPATSTLDLEALAAEWAGRDARGEGIGVPSPTETVQASAAGASIEIRYSRPAKRGRDIWGGLVPYGEVWRTGANAATHFTTDGDITVGDVDVPAGTYTLWTTYTMDSASLIINAQTNQWGTAYDPSQDVGRTAMMASELSEPSERFTISVDGGMMHLDWDTTRFSVPITR